MLLHFYYGHFFRKVIALSAMLFGISVNGMEAEVKVWQSVDKVFSDPTIKTMVHGLIFSQLDLQSISRFATVCKSFKNYSFADVYSHLPKDSVCWEDFHNYKRRTEMLRCISSTENRDLFIFVWSFDKKRRKQELKDLYGLSSSISPDLAMQAYRHDYERLNKALVKKEREGLKQEKRESKSCRRQLKDALWYGSYTNDHMKRMLNGADHLDAFDIISKNFVAQRRSFTAIISEAEYTEAVFRAVCYHKDVDILWIFLGTYIMENPLKAHHYLLKADYRFIHQLAEKKLIDCNVADKYGKRALHYAVKYKDLRTIDQLWGCGASVNVCNNLQRTPLHNACKLGFVDIIESLLEWDDIDVHIKDNKGKEPQDLLSKKNFIAIEMFKQHHRKKQLA